MKQLTPLQEAEIARDNFLQRNWSAYSDHRHPDHKIATDEAQLLARNILRLKGINPDDGIGPEVRGAPL